MRDWRAIFDDAAKRGGLTDAEMMRELGASRGVVVNARKRHGVPVKSDPYCKGQRSEASRDKQRDAILARGDRIWRRRFKESPQGLTFNAFCRLHGLTASTKAVENRARQYGYTFAPSDARKGRGR